MGDLRNKIAKIERAVREKQAFANFLRSNWRNSDKPKHPPEPVRCQCGHSYYDRTLVAIDLGTWPRSQILCCQDCVPEEHRANFNLAVKI